MERGGGGGDGGASPHLVEEPCLFSTAISKHTTFIILSNSKKGGKFDKVQQWIGILKY